MSTAIAALAFAKNANNGSLLKETRKEDVFVQHIETSPDFTFPFEPEKSDESLKIIFHALTNNVFFKQLGDVECDVMARTMKMKACTAGDTLIKQGDTDADLFYVIEKGHFDIIVDGNKVDEGKPGTSFGELALLYNSPRAATVVAKDDGVLWTLPRDLFRRIVNVAVNKVRQEIRTVLKNVPLVQKLSDEQILMMCDIVRTNVKFNAGETIITKGDQGDRFYMIQSGNVECTHIGSTDHKLQLGPGDYFGERALIRSEPRYADVIALTNAVCVTIEKDNFERIFGGLMATLDRNLGVRVLMSLDILNALSPIQKNKLIEECHEKKFEDGEYIVHQGDPGDTFYIITEGKAEVLKSSTESGNVPILIAELGVGDYFGEGALLKDEPRAADIKAKGGPVRTFELDRDSFDKYFNKVRGSISQRLTTRVDHGDDLVRKKAQDLEKQVGFDDLVHIRTLGTGTFGRVKLVEVPKLNKAFALKILQKKQIVDYAQEINVMNEKRILSECHHPFILRLVRTFKDQNCLYLLLELVQGGELFSVIHIHILPHLNDKQAMFYIACVVDVFEYLHDRSIVYRDLKPENLMIDDVGYIKMVDFGFAKKVFDKTYTLCGTPEYLSPEILLSAGHNKATDYWALGILIYEVLTRRCPYVDKDRMVMYEKILSTKPDFPDYYSEIAKDLTLLLLIKEPALRLGNLRNGIRDIKDHPFFTSHGMDFYELRRKRIQPPWKPTIKDYKDSSYFDAYNEEYDVEPFHGNASWDADF